MRIASSILFVVLSACTPVANRAAETATPSRPAAATPVRISFIAQSDSFAAAAREYDALWLSEGPRIVETMERIAGLTFSSSVYVDTAIRANVLERMSNSGFRDESPMVLRASYPMDTKRATLIHELGHRLQTGLLRRDEEGHGPLFLWIYDVWVAMYGKAFADAQVVVERARGGPYPAAWDAAMALTAAQRAERWKALVAERLPTRG